MAASVALALARLRAPSSASVEVLRERGALAALVPAWEELAAHALEPNPFYEHWSVLPALEAFAPREALHFVAVRVHGRLAGLFPFREQPRYKGLPVRALSSWRHRHMLLGTPLVRAELARECLEALFQRLPAPVVEFNCIPAGAPFDRALCTRSSPCVVSEYPRAMLRKSSRVIPSRSLRRAEKRLRELGQLSHVALQPGDAARRWIDEFLALEASGWKGERGSALACNERDRRFAQAMLEAAHHRGQLMIVGLDLDGRPLARQVNLRSGEGSFAWKTAYDERYARFSPGVLNQLENMRHFQSLDGLEWMDSFTGPDNPMVDALWKDRVVIQTVAVGTGARGRLMVKALELARATKRRVQAFTRKSGAAATPCSTAERP
jgi:CelD/BcsL family acetyltransferase involved in cellulose biosynthesis